MLPRGRSRVTRLLLLPQSFYIAAHGLLVRREAGAQQAGGPVDLRRLVRGAALVVTDSGGIQEETTVLGVPCLTLRPNTERPITISHGTNRLVEPAQLGAAADEALSGEGGARSTESPPLWDGHAGERIAAILCRATGT